ncbi:hypothetical protein MSAN_00326500 [Mycena sanguinolenta]|uniref:Uncharacterized protein n=1 Tax=Mycena sanguinolenta TaxID=230812 RepID=A0A8H7DGC8_9AGAR|nr:hypothetical protein MSAN_00326500 [Mycena sanguinolenta]
MTALTALGYQVIRTRLCLRAHPPGLTIEEDGLTIVVRGQGQALRMKLQPRLPPGRVTALRALTHHRPGDFPHITVLTTPSPTPPLLYLLVFHRLPAHPRTRLTLKRVCPRDLCNHLQYQVISTRLGPRTYPPDLMITEGEDLTIVVRVPGQALKEGRKGRMKPLLALLSSGVKRARMRHQNSES